MRLLIFVLAALTSGLFAEKVALYEERYRPRYHFTADQGYINDPNGLFYLDGTYHLFFQHGRIREKVWGHATSTDLLRWEQHKDAITMEGGHPVFSGGAVVDESNTTGFGTNENPPVVAIFTEWGRGQSLAYSTDKGESWQRYDGNPVLKLPNDEKRSFGYSARDPHVMWDKAKERWVMVLYANPEAKETSKSKGNHRTGFSIYTSPDMKEWTFRSHLDGFYVCPDVMQLPTPDGGKQWVAMDWEQYALGEFDGESFTPAHKPRLLDKGANLSANQSWKYLPDGRVIQIAWIRDGKYPGMPFEQQLSFPVELSVREVGGELALCKSPIREIEQLFDKKAMVMGSLDNAVLDVGSQSYVLDLEVELEGREEIHFTALGQPIVLRSDSIIAKGKTSELGEPLTKVRILADITTLEIFANDGAMTMTFHLLPPDEPQPISFKRGEESDGAKLRSAILHSMKSIWK